MRTKDFFALPIGTDRFPLESHPSFHYRASQLSNRSLHCDRIAAGFRSCVSLLGLRGEVNTSYPVFDQNIYILFLFFIPSNFDSYSPPGRTKAVISCPFPDNRFGIGYSGDRNVRIILHCKENSALIALIFDESGEGGVCWRRPQNGGGCDIIDSRSLPHHDLPGRIFETGWKTQQWAIVS